MEWNKSENFIRKNIKHLKLCLTENFDGVFPTVFSYSVNIPPTVAFSLLKLYYYHNNKTIKLKKNLPF